MVELKVLYLNRLCQQGNNKNLEFDEKRLKRENVEYSTLEYIDETNSVGTDNIEEYFFYNISNAIFNLMEMEHGRPVIKYKMGHMRSEYLC